MEKPVHLAKMGGRAGTVRRMVSANAYLFLFEAHEDGSKAVIQIRYHLKTKE
jgi:hypothetical protein